MEDIYPDELFIAETNFPNSYNQGLQGYTSNGISERNMEALLSELHTLTERLRNQSYSGVGISEVSEIELTPEEYKEGGPAGAIIAGAGLVFNVLSSAVATVRQGDVEVNWPTSSIGVTVSNPPKGLRLNTLKATRTIFKYRDVSPAGVEQVNIQLECTVLYNGLEVQATFKFAPNGKRSRLMRDTQITISNPLTIQTKSTPENWKKVGINEYPVVRIPISVHVDRPWPLSNYNQTFDLVLSGMYGFGKDARRIYKENVRTIRN